MTESAIEDDERRGVVDIELSVDDGDARRARPPLDRRCQLVCGDAELAPVPLDDRLAQVGHDDDHPKLPQPRPIRRSEQRLHERRRQPDAARRLQRVGKTLVAERRRAVELKVGQRVDHVLVRAVVIAARHTHRPDADAVEHLAERPARRPPLRFPLTRPYDSVAPDPPVLDRQNVRCVRLGRDATHAELERAIGQRRGDRVQHLAAQCGSLASDRRDGSDGDRLDVRPQLRRDHPLEQRRRESVRALGRRTWSRQLGRRGDAGRDRSGRSTRWPSRRRRGDEGRDGTCCGRQGRRCEGGRGRRSNGWRCGWREDQSGRCRRSRRSWAGHGQDGRCGGSEAERRR